MLKQIDWKFLRRPIIIFVVLLLSSFVFYFGGLHYLENSNEKFTLSKNNLSASHSKLNRQSNEIKLVDDYLKQYKALENNAFIGEERRLSWIESMRATNKKIKLPRFDYSIHAQEEFIRPGLKQNKVVKAVASKMDLNLGLLHEEDLFRVFDLLDENVQSYFNVESCEFSKSKQGELKVDEANLTVHCILNWVHLKVAKK